VPLGSEKNYISHFPEKTVKSLTEHKAFLYFKKTILSDVTPYSPVNIHSSFGGI
jgi:hypothetical protein